MIVDDAEFLDLLERFCEAAKELGRQDDNDVARGYAEDEFNDLKAQLLEMVGIEE